MLVSLACLQFSAVLAAGTPSPEPPVRLEWRAPGECPGEQAVEAALASLRRYRPSRAEAALDVRAVVRRHGPRRWTLRLTLRAGRATQTRALEADECGLLVRATALLVAMRLDPASVAAVPVVDEALPPSFPALVEAELPAPVVRVPAPPPAVRRAEPPRGAAVVREAAIEERPREKVVRGAPVRGDAAREGPARPRLRGHVRVEGGLDGGVSPGLGGGLGGFGGLSIGGVRIELGVSGAPARERSAAGVEGRFDRVAAGLRICPGWRVPRDRGVVRLFGCVGVEAGAIRAEAVAGVARPNVQWAPWSGVLFGAAARWAVAGPLGLWFAVEGVGALTRPVFTVGAAETPLFRVGPAGVRVNFGLELQFPSRDR